MELISIKKYYDCDKCGKRIHPKSDCYLEIHESNGGPFLQIFCLTCGG